MKKHKNYFRKTVKYFQEHKGVQIEIADLIQRLKIPEKKLTSAFITILRRRLNKQGVILRAFPDCPRKTRCLMAAWRDGKENQDAIEYELKRHVRATKQAQQRTDQHVEICQQILGYNPLLQLEGEEHASNSSDS